MSGANTCATLHVLPIIVKVYFCISKLTHAHVVNTGKVAH